MTSSLSGEILRFSNSSFRIVSNSALADSKSKSSLNWVGGADLPPVLIFLLLIKMKKMYYLILVVSIWKVSLVILIGAAVVIILSIALVIVTSIALK